MQYADSKEVEAAVLKMFPPKPVPIEFQQDFDDTVMDVSNRKRSSKMRTKQ